MKSNTLSVEDRIAINDLFAKYAWALDTGDVDSLVACFTPDGVVIEEVFEEPDRWEGHAGIRRLGEHFRNSAGFPGRQHHITQSVFQGGGDRCKARSFAFVTECRGEPPYTLRFAGYYDDEIVKAGGEWLLKQRIIRLWDGEVLKNFPGHDGKRVLRRRPPELVVKQQQK
jgi:hypothetical protein